MVFGFCPWVTEDMGARVKALAPALTFNMGNMKAQGIDKEYKVIYATRTSYDPAVLMALTLDKVHSILK
jgi:hypothetical protein